MLRFLRAIASSLGRYRLQASLLFVGFLVDLAFDAIFPLSLKFLIDDAIVPGDSDKLVLILSILAGSFVVFAAVAVGRDYLYAVLGTRMLNDMRARLFTHIQRLPVTLFERIRPGDLTARFSSDLGAVEHAIVTAIPVGLLAAMGFVMSVGLMIALQPRLALIALLSLPMALIVPRVLARRANAAAFELKQEQGGLIDTVQENVSAQQIVKAFGLEQAAVTSFTRQLSTIGKTGTRANFLAGLMERGPNLAVVAVHVAVLWVGAVYTLNGSISVGSFVSFNTIFINVTLNVYGITYTLPELVRSAAGYRRIKEIFDEQPDAANDPDATVLGPLRTAIAFRDVSFSYDEDTQTLRDVTLVVPRGSSIAIVGPSGSGKSTLIRLLMRFQDPTSGQVLIDGTDVRTVTRESLREKIGVVFQENFLFNASIRENIRLARPDATDQEVADAAKAAEIHDFIESLPAGYDSIVGERGGRLSGGERQRVSIARAFLRRPEILVLDEATSALDPGTESALQATMERVRGDRTMISATHRLSSAANADRIIVMEAGRIAEQGTHDELLTRDGLYARLWEKQGGIFVSDAGDRAEVEPARLRGIPILDELDDQFRADVAAALTTERFDAGRDVFAEGDPGDKFYMIARGKVEVLRGERRIDTLDDGDHFGEVALVTGEARNATVRTLYPSVFLVLSRRTFVDLLDRQERFRAAVDAAVRKRLDTPPI